MSFGTSPSSRALVYPLGPIDHMLLATSEALRARGYCGLNVLLIAELEGPLDVPALAVAVRRLGQEYPALSARVGFSPLLRRARWEIDPRADGAGAIEFVSHDAEAEPVAADRDAPLRAALGESLDPQAGGGLRLIHQRLNEGRHRLTLRWPHHLMDLEGAQLLLAQLDALLCGRPLALGRDPRAAFAAPFAPWFPLSYWRVWRGRLRHLGYCLINQPRLVRKPEGAPRRPTFELRCYDAAFRARFEETARARTAAGPLRYVRGLLIAVARTYLAMCQERGRPRKRYLFSHALPLPRNASRPGVHGTHVTVPWIGFTPSDLRSWEAADAAARRQFTAYAARRRDEANWLMLRATGRWPFALARYFATHRHPRAAAGVTTYRFGAEPLRLGDATITKLAATGTMNCHPGWIVADSTYRDTMAISLGYFEDYLDAGSVVEFLDRLERALVGEQG